VINERFAAEKNFDGTGGALAHVRVHERPA
jgi:hypothetical protein